MIFVAQLATAQVPTVHDGELALGFEHSRAGQSATWLVDYVEHAGEPAFRLQVHHFHDECSGYLYIGKTKFAYVPVFTPGQKDGFQIERAGLKSVSPRYSGFSFTVGDKVQEFAFLSDSTRRSSSTQDSREQLMLFVNLMMADFDLAQNQFGRIVAGWQQLFAPNPAPNQPAGVSGFRIFSPPGVANGKLVYSTRDLLVVVGVVAQPTPVKSVWMNGQPIAIRPIMKNVVEFQSTPVQLQGGTTSVTVATTFDSGELQMTFAIRKPAITFAAGVLRTADPTATVKGTLIGYGEVERVEIDGKVAALVRNPDSSIAFETAGIAIQPGKNTLQGAIVGIDGTQHAFSVVVERKPRLTLDFVRRAIPTLSRARFADLLDEYGVDFQLDDATIKQLRTAGADQSLLEAIAEAAH
jgi:hypothetical protein